MSDRQAPEAPVCKGLHALYQVAASFPGNTALSAALQPPEDQHFECIIHTARRMAAYIFTVQFEIFPAAHMLIKTRKLNDTCHSFEHLIGSRRQLFPKQLNCPMSRFPEICEHLHHACLACAVWTEKTVDLSLFTWRLTSFISFWELFYT